MTIRLGRAMLATFACAAAAVLAQQPAMTSPEALAILDELRQIRQLLERMQQQPARAAQPAAPPEGPVRIALDGAYVLGRPDAPVTMVEFSDYECPFCRQYHMASFEKIKRDYIDTGKVRYVSRDLPLDFHPHAKPAAKAARCAGEQGRFWEMRRALIVNGNALGPQLMAGLARELKLDEAAFGECVASTRYDKAIADDVSAAAAVGISGTPTFVVGRSDAAGVEGQKVIGAQPVASFEERIQALLAPVK